MSQSDTSPMVPSQRVKKLVQITEHNRITRSLNTNVEYESDNLPSWFAPLQAVVEDTTFTSMAIILGNGDVQYIITAVEL